MNWNHCDTISNQKDALKSKEAFYMFSKPTPVLPLHNLYITNFAPTPVKTTNQTLEPIKGKMKKALQDACLVGDVSRVQWLLNIGDERAKELINCVSFGYTPLMWASAGGYIRIVQLLVMKGADVNISNSYDDYTALLLATQSGDVNIVHYLLTKGANLHARDKEGRTALILACYNGSLRLVRYLLKNGAKINEATDCETNEGWTCLMSAVDEGHSEIVQYLIEKGANVNVQNQDGISPVLLSCKLYAPKVLKYLLQVEDINVDVISNTGTTALLDACKASKLAHVKLLLRRGANVNIGDNHGLTPLMYASRFGCVEIARELIQNGAIINISDEYLMSNRYPLHYAAESKCGEIVKVLVRNGANVNVQDAEGKTPLQWARCFNNTIAIDVISRIQYNQHFYAFLQLETTSCKSPFWKYLPKPLFKVIWEYYRK